MGAPRRSVHVDAIRKAVRAMALSAAFELDRRALTALEDARARETSPVGRGVLDDIVANARLAAAERRPLCQDTGLAVVWVELGAATCVEGGSLLGAINEGVRAAWHEGALRASVAADPLARGNTGDNTPAFVHVDLVEGRGVRIRFMAKGGGSENRSRLAMLRPSDGRAGVADWVVETVGEGAAFACPPVVIGVGVGGAAEHAAWMAKRALFRPLGEPAGDEATAALEREIVGRVNASGVGPMGLGGGTTALACHVERAPCHIASLPVALCLGCHSHRVRSVDL